MSRASDRAVSIPIGNIFMVGLAVVVAVLLSVFAVNFVNDTQVEPQDRGVSFSYSPGADELTISYRTGPETGADRLLVRGDDHDGQVTFGSWSDLGGGDPIETGDSVTLSNVTGNERISIVYRSGGSTTVIQTWEN